MKRYFLFYLLLLLLVSTGCKTVKDLLGYDFYQPEARGTIPDDSPWIAVAHAGDHKGDFAPYMKTDLFHTEFVTNIGATPAPGYSGWYYNPDDGEWEWWFYKLGGLNRYMTDEDVASKNAQIGKTPWIVAGPGTRFVETIEFTDGEELHVAELGGYSFLKVLDIEFPDIPDNRILAYQNDRIGAIGEHDRNTTRNLIHEFAASHLILTGEESNIAQVQMDAADLRSAPYFKQAMSLENGQHISLGTDPRGVLQNNTRQALNEREKTMHMIAGNEDMLDALAKARADASGGEISYEEARAYYTKWITKITGNKFKGCKKKEASKTPPHHGGSGRTVE